MQKCHARYIHNLSRSIDACILHKILLPRCPLDLVTEFRNKRK